MHLHDIKQIPIVAYLARLAPSFSFGGTTPVSLQRSSMELFSVQAAKHPKLLLYLA
ncbi:hypothetical protein HMPREF1556_01792 [Porphyromonas sp. oral taxon 278 str. W7784]|nr:hypothetical protein HMPREF1556_01792 [Porphyromonas sp. oral taxon 278 str. W7784]